FHTTASDLAFEGGSLPRSRERLSLMRRHLTVNQITDPIHATTLAEAMGASVPARLRWFPMTLDALAGLGRQLYVPLGGPWVTPMNSAAAAAAGGRAGRGRGSRQAVPRGYGGGNRLCAVPPLRQRQGRHHRLL